MLTHPTNVTILRAQRPGAYDRYGAAKLSLLFGPERGFLERRPRYARGTSGDVVEVDADLVLPKRLVLRPKDVVRLADADESDFEVFDVDESLDHLGQVVSRTYGLTKIRKDS